MSTVLTTEITDLLTVELGRAPTADEIIAAENDALLMAKVQQHLNIGLNETTIDDTVNLADVMADFATDGGGKVNLLAGTYVLTSDLTIPSNVTIVGQSSANTVIYCGAFSVRAEGTSIYDIGSVVAVSSGVIVTGAGTSWLANVSAGQSIFLGTRWYLISDVAADDTIILAEGYGDDIVFPISYRTATIAGDINIEKVNFYGSSGTGLIFKDCRRVDLKNLLFVASNIGATLENGSEIALGLIGAFANTLDGIQGTSIGLCDWSSVNCDGNGGNGITLYNVKKLSILPGDFEGNGGNGIQITLGTQMDFLVAASGNTGNGFEIISDCSNLDILNSGAVGNGGDGIKFDESTSDSKIYGTHFTGNAGYGLNIVTAGSADSIISMNNFAGNGSGAVNDGGTDTLIRSNIGVADN